jgi:hypothetical protein
MTLTLDTAAGGPIALNRNGRRVLTLAERASAVSTN